MHQNQDRLATPMVCSCSAQSEVEAPVRDPTHEPSEACRQQCCNETNIVDAIQSRRMQHVDKKAMQHDRDHAPERHTDGRVPNCMEGKFSEPAPDAPGCAKQ